MPAYTANGIELVAADQSGWHVKVNSALVQLSTVFNTSVKDRDLTSPPGSPSNNDAYLVASSASGDWSGKDGKIATYYDGWYYMTPTEGMQLTVQDEDVRIEYNGSEWIEIPSTSHIWKVDHQAAGTVAASIPQIEFYGTSSDTLLGEIGFTSNLDTHLRIKNNDSNGGLLFQTSSSTPITILSDGSIGINTGSPTYDFQVGGDTGANTNVVVLGGDCRIGKTNNGVGYLGARNATDEDIDLQIRCQSNDSGNPGVVDAIYCTSDASGNALVGIGMNVSDKPDTFTLEVKGDTGPSSDNLYDLGGSNRWVDIHLVNQPTVTSDADMKTSAETLDPKFGLSFVNSLNPVSFKWQDQLEEVKEVERVERVPVTKTVTKRREVDEVVDGKRRIRIETYQGEEPIMELVDIIDEFGTKIAVESRPKYEDITKIDRVVIPARTHHRKHTGFLAQEVVSVLTAAGVDLEDFAGICLDASGRYGMRYNELFAPIVLAIQQISARLDALENPV